MPKHTRFLVARRFRIAAALALCCCAAAGAQEAVPSAVKDEVFARKILMDTVDRAMDDIDWMGETIDLPKGIGLADTISAMLLALPHLFPPATNRWQPNVAHDPARNTFAAPELWTNFPDFYRRAAEASQLALDASKAKRADDFKRLIGELHEACEGCHAAYVKNE